MSVAVHLLDPARERPQVSCPRAHQRGVGGRGRDRCDPHRNDQAEEGERRSDPASGASVAGYCSSGSGHDNPRGSSTLNGWPAPTGLADGLALRSQALPADHRRIRPDVLGSPLPASARRGFGTHTNTRRRRRVAKGIARDERRLMRCRSQWRSRSPSYTRVAGAGFSQEPLQVRSAADPREHVIQGDTCMSISPAGVFRLTPFSRSPPCPSRRRPKRWRARSRVGRRQGRRSTAGIATCGKISLPRRAALT